MKVQLFLAGETLGEISILGYSSIGNAMVGLVLASAEDRLFMHGGKKGLVVWKEK